MRLSFDGSAKSFGNPRDGQLSLHSSTDSVLPDRVPCFTVITNIPGSDRSPTQWVKNDTTGDYKYTLPYGYGVNTGGAPNNSPLSSMTGWATSNTRHSGVATDNYHRWSGPSDTDTSIMTYTPNHKYRYTIPVTGYWHFVYGYLSGNISTDSVPQASSICVNGKAALLGVYGVGNARMTYMNHSLSWNTIMAGVILRCFAGDYVDVRFRTGENGASYFGPDCNYFNGKLLSRF